ncbi:hypothetical protein AN5423.2 [Aspergillus nidulans FGSC A4]|uniref:Azaphilone pigments biosynthesis cluster protein L N-terminal domain-containing protein n=1 Tax=Emericella nidulans (strain FGSC A4 / ATCC 38163 / CBS 112.46 / NRRL 194 / M139) TaxID=227321 RepID=Q5B207_EMENI|nr:hypothetical protein [Aspergillus nidulans FGSC A4]EAA62583.1 hypothetical protein AN5423.2 [Aspergillus nidulans FGSC A4]CBF81933.1 TPA: conserved hypothetical protein [Aspergillus nidulans FGSC A4]|eukprot:XP_663027.1 hypothetical protein AN5423.2 [Aspergillus nidulans FGSC A4]
MADPLSIAASMLAVITAAVESVKSLHSTVKRFKDRDKTLRRLRTELEDLTNILGSLGDVINAEMPMLALLQGPVERCNQLCREFELAMENFGRKSTTGFRDWAKMEFMRGDINEFIDNIAGYKSTINVGLGTITIHSSKVTERVLREYNEMVQDTAYDLDMHLQRIDKKLALLTAQDDSASDVSVDLEDEREVTKQCLRICEDAKNFIESLTQRESAVLQEVPRNVTLDDVEKRFEAQLLTRQTLDENRAGFADIISRLQARLNSLITNGNRSSEERLALQEDIQISRQCLEVCNMANEVSRQKIYRIGEVVADGDSDQVVVNTLADLFDIKKALSKDTSAQLVGSMTDASLQNLTDKRYSSRFGAVDSKSTEVVTRNSPSTLATQNDNPPVGIIDGGLSQRIGARRSKPSPNEMRKRGAPGTAKSDDE